MTKNKQRAPMMRRAILGCALAGVMALYIPVSQARTSAESPADYASKMQAWSLHQEMEASSEFGGLTWRDVGPVEQGGRVVDIAPVPGSPYSFYVAYASGGLWRTDNNGVTFRPLFDQQPTLIMGDIANDPNLPDRLWVGTGEPNSSRSSYGGLGVYRTDDGGETWQHTGLGETDRIGRIVVDPNDSDRVFVAALGRLYTDGGRRGVFRTVDAGKTWEQVLVPNRKNTGAVDLVMHPSDSNILYASTWERTRRSWNFVEGGAGSAIYKTTDGGDSWTRLGGGLPTGEYVGRMGVALATSQPNTLYVAVDNQEPTPEAEWDLGDRPLSAKRLRGMDKETFLRQDPSEVERFIRSSDLDTSLDAEELLRRIRESEVTVADILDELGDANANLFNTDIRGLEVYRSDDAGDSWRRTHDEPLDNVVFTYGYYFGQVHVAPDDPDLVYTMGVPLIQSKDGGQNWRRIESPDVHVDHHYVWTDPDNTQRLLLGNDGGIDVSYDGGETWAKLDAQPVGQFYTIAVDMAEPYNVYGGLQDNGTWRGSSRTEWQSGGRWTRINGGDGMYVAVDPRDNQTVYSGFQFGFYNRAGGGARRTVRPRDAVGETALRYNWNTPVILSPHNPDIVYFGANKLFRSMNQGEDWVALSDDLSKSRQQGDVPFGTITTVSESTLEFGLIWAGTDDGEVRVTQDGGKQWKDVAARLPGDRWVSRVEASQHSRDRAYVSLNGYRNDDTAAYVFRTDSLGRRWKDISDGLPAEAVNVVKEDPVNADVIYVGTDRGVYVSTNGGEDWGSLQSGLPNVPVHDLVVHPRERELVAGTHGRSAWIVDVLPVQDLTTDVREKPIHLFYADSVKASGRWWRRRANRWFDQQADLPSASFTFWSAESGEASWEILDASNRPVQRGSLAAYKGVNRFDWDLLVDPELALAAERANNEDEPTDLSQTPYAESQRLGHRMFIEPGDYTVKISRGDGESTADWIVKPLDSPPARQKPAPKMRGR